MLDRFSSTRGDMRSVLILLLALIVGVAFGGAVLPPPAEAAPCHGMMRMAMPGHAPAPAESPHGLHACCLLCAGVALETRVGDRAGAQREEPVRFCVVIGALSGRTMRPALGPPKRAV